MKHALMLNGCVCACDQWRIHNAMKMVALKVPCMPARAYVEYQKAIHLRVASLLWITKVNEHVECIPIYDSCSPLLRVEWWKNMSACVQLKEIRSPCPQNVPRTLYPKSRNDSFSSTPCRYSRPCRDPWPCLPKSSRKI